MGPANSFSHQALSCRLGKIAVIGGTIAPLFRLVFSAGTCVFPHGSPDGNEK
jgi:hypothetical protein